MIISKTPYRISFFGGGSDYPNWFNKFTGQVLSTTINKHIYITCRFLPKFFKHNFVILYNYQFCKSFLQVKCHKSESHRLKILLN